MTSASRGSFSRVFSQILRRRRLDRGLSQEALSELAEVDRTYVGLLERGKRSPGLEVAKRLATGLGVPLTDLIAETESQMPAPRATSSRRTRRSQHESAP